MYLNVDVKLNNIKIMITSIMPNLDIVKKKKKSRDITLQKKVQNVMVFPVVMHEYENWTIKKFEH